MERSFSWVPDFPLLWVSALPMCQYAAIAESYDVGTILGAQVIGGIVAILVGFTIRKSVCCFRLLLQEP